MSERVVNRNWSLAAVARLARRLQVAAVMLVLVFAHAARAADVEGRILSMGIGGSGDKQGTTRAGAWVPIRVHVENRTGKQFVGMLGVEQPDLDGDRVMSKSREIILSPGDVEGRDVWLYYWPRPDLGEGTPSVVVLSGKNGSEAVATIPGKIARSQPLMQDRWVVILGASSMGMGAYYQAVGGTQPVSFSWVQATRQLPDDVLGYDGVDVIVWQADEVKASDFGAAEKFQLKAILDWVQAGGHLVISVSKQARELQAIERLRASMPMELRETREIKISDLNAFSGLTLPPAAPQAARGELLLQATGIVKPGARPVNAATQGIFSDHPIAVRGAYGQGAVTIITMDMGNPTLLKYLSNEDWLNFWNQSVGLQGQARTHIKSRALYDFEEREAVKRGDNSAHPVPGELQFGATLSKQVDTEGTMWRFLISLLFLGLYWLAAGPIGHFILRYYKVVHWSWWIFGGTVIVAAGVAGAVVTFLQITNYDLRHKTIVMGAVGSRDVSTVGYYGVFAPRNGLIKVEQPESPAGGLNYLTPLCLPTNQGISPFADPQSYDLLNQSPQIARPVFRNTLKKLQGRWWGQMDGITGRATRGSDRTLAGQLENKSGYDLHDTMILMHTYAGRVGQGFTFVYEVGTWKNGQPLNLATQAKLLTYPSGNPVAGEELMRLLAASQASRGVHMPGLPGLNNDENILVRGRSPELLYLLLDLAALSPLNDPARVETDRGPLRAMDRTKSLYASGGLIVARSDPARKVKNPVPITVNDYVVEGNGEILFAWTLPLEGGSTGGGMLDPESPGRRTPARRTPGLEEEP